MSDPDTKSGILACPGCAADLLVEAPADATSATVTCWNCDRPFEVAGSTLDPDEAVLS